VDNEGRISALAEKRERRKIIERTVKIGE